MKELIKKWWFWLVIVLILALIIFTVILLNSSNDGVGSAGISKEEFNEIIVGQTTNFELNSIIDKNDEWNEDEVYDKCVEEIENFKKDNKYTYVYKYYGEKGGYAIITLQADYSNGYYYNDVVVIKKENFNLK
jgi:hypothetical protein